MSGLRSFAKRLLTTAGTAAVVVLLVSCGDDDDNPQIGCTGGTFDVTVTLPMFAEFACTVGGDNVNVRSLMPLEADPHSYVPPESAAELVSKAKLILYAGLELDEPLRQYIFTHGRGSAQLIAYAKSITSPTVEQPPEDQPRIDAQQAGDNPYLWLDPELAIGYIDVTRDSLEIVDAENIPEYRAAMDEYVQRIRDLQVEMTEDLSVIPGENRMLFTLHDSVFHFARRFGFEVLGHLTDPGAVPAATDIEAAVQAVRDSGVPAIFTEVGYESSVMQQVADEAEVELCALYTDRADADAHTYGDMMRANAEELARCLGA